MATKTKAELKVYFETGKRPIQQEFENLIDSKLNIIDDKASEVDIDGGDDNNKFVTPLGAKRAARKSLTVNGVIANLTTGNIELPATEVPLAFTAGLTRSTNSISVNTSQVINKLTNLNTNGFVKTKNADGTLEVVATIPTSSISGTTLPPGITALEVTGNITSSSGAIGYVAGNGGTASQTGSTKSDAATLNKLTGNITLNPSSLAASTIVSFTLTNNTIGANDVIFLQHQSGGTFGAYTLHGRTSAGSATIVIRNNSASALSEALIIKFIVIKAAIN